MDSDSGTLPCTTVSRGATSVTGGRAPKPAQALQLALGINELPALTVAATC